MNPAHKTASVWLVLGLFHVLKASAALKTNLLALAMLYNPLRSVLDTLAENDGLMAYKCVFHHMSNCGHEQQG